MSAEDKKKPSAEAEDSADAAMGPEFFLDQPSPADSPRDKKQRLEDDRPSSSPQRSPRNNFSVAASPPRFVSFEEIMRAASGVSNMALAHEITVNNEFKFQKSEPNEGSIEKQVKDTMQKAFWDALREKLGDDPPDLSHAMVLLQEVKENLEEILLPHHTRLRAQIKEVIDLELIEQQADAGTLDFHQYAAFVVDMMSKLCAPARDEEVAKLQEIKEIVPLFQEIFRVLDLLKMDMANFTIQQIRPYLQQQSVNYERTKFQQLLKSQEDNGTDGLELTRQWLRRNAQIAFNPAEQAQASTSAAAPKPTPNFLLNTAYLEVLDWDYENIYPEALLMDEHRFRDIHQKAQWLILVSSVLLITYNAVGAPIAGISELKKQLKQHITDILDGVAFTEFNGMMPNISTQVIKDVQACLIKHGFTALPEDRELLLKGQVEGVASPDHPVHKIIKSRLFNFIRNFISSPSQNPQVLLPTGFSAVAEELSHVCGQFARLISHNRAVFGVFYADIISTLLKEHESAEAKT